MQTLFNRPIFVLAAASFLLAFNMTPVQASVLGFLPPKLVTQEGAEDSWEVEVRCQGTSNRMTIVSETANGPWCPKEFPSEFCKTKKIDVASLVCSSSYRRKLKIADEAKQRITLENQKTKIALEQQKQKIQQALITLEQRKQGLLSRETDLDNRELEIKKRFSDL